jgi:hypothetical protein
MVILCPLEFERRALRRVARRLGVRLECTGPGNGAARWIERAGLAHGTRVILAGVAAGLTEVARPGTAWRADAVVDADGASDAWRPSLEIHGAPPGRFACVARALLDPPSKARVAATTGAIIADMESAPFARAAERAGARWAVIRGVSDGARDMLPAQVEAWTDAGGRTRLGSVAGSVLRRPALLPVLLRLGRDGSLAMAAVARALLLETSAPPDRDPP